MSDDPYWDEKNNILRNKLGITDPDKLAKAEYALTVRRIREIVDSPIPGSYDEAHLNQFHKKIFEPVYDWAGVSREETGWTGEKPEEILNMQSAPYPTVYGENGEPTLREKLTEAFDNLAADNNLKGLEPDQFVELLTDHATDIWTAHSHREGNTRTTTEFFRQLAKDAGHPFAPEFPEQKSNFRDALALASIGYKTELTEHFRAGVMPIEISENAINAREKDLVNKYLENKDIDFDLTLKNTASQEYIDKAVVLLDEARAEVNPQLLEDLPKEHRRVELQDRLDAESVLFEKFVAINSELFELDLAVKASQAGQDIDISGVADRQHELTKELYLDKELDTGLDFNRKEEGMLRANAFRQALEFQDVPLLENSGEKAFYSSRRLRVDIPADRSKRSLDHSKSLLRGVLRNDLAKKVANVEMPGTRSKLQTSITVEDEKRNILVNKAINKQYPEHAQRVATRLNHETANAHLKEIKSLSRENNRIADIDYTTQSKIRNNDYRISYLSNKLENTPQLSKYLTNNDKQSISGARKNANERSSKVKSVEIER